MKYINFISSFILPFFVFFIVVTGVFKKVDIYSSFYDGIKESIKTILQIMPSVTTLMIAIFMLKESKAFDIIIKIIEPLFLKLDIPKEILTLMFLKPLSGSGSIAVLNDILKTWGPDSKTGLISSVICASTETTFYALAVYFGSVDVKDTGYTVFCALVADFMTIVSGIIFCRILLLK